MLFVVLPLVFSLGEFCKTSVNVWRTNNVTALILGICRGKREVCNSIERGDSGICAKLWCVDRGVWWFPMGQIDQNQVPLKEPTLKLGFYGCVGGVVRLEALDVSFPRVVRLDCPACGHNHVARPFWRKVIPALDDGVTSTQIDLAHAQV